MNVSAIKENDYTFNALVIVVPQVVFLIVEILELINPIDIMTRLTLCLVSLCSLMGYYLPVIIPSNKNAINKYICIALPYIYVSLMLSSQIYSEQDLADGLEKKSSLLSNVNIKQVSQSSYIIKNTPGLIKGENPDILEMDSQIDYFMPDKLGPSLHEQFTNILMTNSDIKSVEIISKRDEQIILDFSTVLYDFMRNKDWVNFLEHTELHSHIQETITISLNSAIASGAPIELVQTLNNMGGEFSPVSLTPQFGSGDLEYIQSVENLGLSLTDQHAFSMSLVDISLMVPTHPDVFEYVIQQNLQYISDYNEIGLDPIGMAIVNASVNHRNVGSYIKKLHNSGAIINSHHKYLMALLKKENQQIYTQITNAVSNLRYEKVP